jgi:hypothetical protein
VTLVVYFDSAGPERVTELLPHTRRLVSDIAGLQLRAFDLIWEPGPEGTVPPGTRELFDSVVRPITLTVFRTGDFELCFEDGGTYVEDCYWIAVTFRADATPVHAYIDC